MCVWLGRPDHICGRACGHVFILERCRKNFKEAGESAGMSMRIANVYALTNAIVPVHIMFDVACAGIHDCYLPVDETACFSAAMSPLAVVVSKII